MTYGGERIGCSRSDQWECLRDAAQTFRFRARRRHGRRPAAADRLAGESFLHAVASALQGQEVGPGLVARTCAELQRQFWRPPDFSRSSGSSKYR